MRRLLLGSALAAGVGALALPAGAESMAGVCPDGSAFVVQRRADVPCANAKLVRAAELPPLRPELLPKPYMWYVDQETRNEQNPYNLVDPAHKLRGLRAQEALAEPGTSPKPEVAPLRPLTSVPSRREAPAFEPQDLRDLIRLIALRQEVAPATLSIDNAQGHEQLRIVLAHSEAFEVKALEALGLHSGEHRVLAFFSHAIQDTTFHPNFLLVQDGATFRPDPSDAREVGLLVGEPGELDSGLLVAGYLVVPERFDVQRPMDIYWNDRSIHVLLRH